MHLLKPKCQEKGLQKLLCTSDVLQMGALILYPPSFKPPAPPPNDTDVRGLVIEEELKNPKPWNLYRRFRNSKTCLQAAFLQQYAILKTKLPRICCGKSQKLQTDIDYCTAASMHTDERERSLTTNLWLAPWWMRHDGGNGILRTKSGDAAHGVASSRYILLDPCAKAKEWWCPFGPKTLESYKTRVAPHALLLPLSHATECNHPCIHTVTASYYYYHYLHQIIKEPQNQTHKKFHLSIQTIVALFLLDWFSQRGSSTIVWLTNCSLYPLAQTWCLWFGFGICQWECGSEISSSRFDHGGSGVLIRVACADTNYQHLALQENWHELPSLHTVQIKCTAEWRPWPHPPIHPQMPMHPEINQQIKLSLAHSLEKQWHFNPSIQSSCAKTNPKHTKKRVKIGGFRVLNKTLVVILLSSQS